MVVIRLVVWMIVPWIYHTTLCALLEHATVCCSYVYGGAHHVLVLQYVYRRSLCNESVVSSE